MRSIWSAEHLSAKIPFQPPKFTTPNQCYRNLQEIHPRLPEYIRWFYQKLTRTSHDVHGHPQLGVIGLHAPQEINPRRIHEGEAGEIQDDALGEELVSVFQPLVGELDPFPQHRLGVQARLPHQEVLEAALGGEAQTAGVVEDLQAFDFLRLEGNRILKTYFWIPRMLLLTPLYLLMSK